MRIVWTLTLLGASLAGPAAAQTEPDTLRWMTGRWVGTVGQAVAEEQWSDAAAGAKMGMFRWVEAGRVAVYEFLIIRREGSELMLRFKHFNDGLRGREEKDGMVVLRAVQIGARDVVFERDEPRLRILYRLESPDRLISVLEQGSGDSLQRTQFTFRRAAT